MKSKYRVFLTNPRRCIWWSIVDFGIFNDMEMPLLMGAPIGGYHWPRSPHTWLSQTERWRMGVPLSDSRRELTPSVRCPSRTALGQHRPDCTVDHRYRWIPRVEYLGIPRVPPEPQTSDQGPSRAVPHSDPWVPWAIFPWLVYGRSTRPASSAPDWAWLRWIPGSPDVLNRT